MIYAKLKNTHKKKCNKAGQEVSFDKCLQGRRNRSCPEVPLGNFEGLYNF